MQDFKHIRAWQRAHALAIAIHKQTRHFSGMGYSHLRPQLTRAADSIASTSSRVAAPRPTRSSRFLDMSIKPDNELEYHLLESRDLAPVSST
jgi:four helix bundle protein